MRLLTYRSQSLNPFSNLAKEQLFMEMIEENEQLLFLWQNSKTVVIGRNQNPWKECRVANLEKDGGFLAKRLSGGGAVYHDDGNLNFTFISPRAAYDQGKNTEIIVDAVRSFGLDARKSGRNDIEIDGAKFSGNAFFRTSRSYCHHGTLMVCVDTSKLADYLQPDPRKLKARSVDSVRSRVINLQDLNTSITIKSLSQALITAFSHAYNEIVCEISPSRLPEASALKKAEEFFQSSHWRYGKSFTPTHSFDERFNWGTIDIQLKVEGGIIKDALVYSDALDLVLVDELRASLINDSYDTSKFTELFEKLANRKVVL